MHTLARVQANSRSSAFVYQSSVTFFRPTNPFDCFNHFVYVSLFVHVFIVFVGSVLIIIIVAKCMLCVAKCVRIVITISSLTIDWLIILIIMICVIPLANATTCCLVSLVDVDKVWQRLGFWGF